MALRSLCTCAVLLTLVGCASTPQPSREVTWEAALPVPQAVETARAGSLWHASTSRQLFSDLRARRVGDLLTVRLVERTNAQKSADTEITKESGIRAPNPTILGRPVSLGNGYTAEVDANIGRDFSGESLSRQSNQLQGNITVTVRNVMPNGYLLIAGEKWMSLNQGDEYLRLSGIVRPEDIATDNTVASTQIADARIEYSGTGALADSNRPGWLSRFFVSPAWPF